MPLDWEQEGRAPSRAELEREEHEDMMRDTYEYRYQEFCRAWRLDPEDGESVLIYELEWEEEYGRYRPEGGGDPAADPGG
jgi:hypothetical protein